MAALVLVGWLAMGAAAQTPIARFIYEDAENAFAQGDYPLALTRLREAEQAFGKINPPILYLRIQARHELLKAKGDGPVDFNLLDPLRGDVQRYLKDYGNNAVLVDQVREVYQLSRELERYPADRAAYEARLAREQRAAEQARQAEEQRRGEERARLSQPGRTFRDCPLCPEMVVVPGGTLVVQAFDGPREIEIQPFAISRRELTVEQWWHVQGQPIPRAYQHQKNHPVDGFRFNPHGPMGDEPDLWRWLGLLEKKTGQRYHLPSEAQWEWACRGGEQHRFCGSDDLQEVAWGNKLFTQPRNAVGQKKPNGYGLFDMTGNVVEGTADSWSASYDPPRDGGPRFSSVVQKKERVAMRGGHAVMGFPEAFEVGYRQAYPYFGIRLARPLVRGQLGMVMETAKPQGALVTSLGADSAAARASIQAGDVIVEIDGRPILTYWSVIAYVSTLEAGRTVRITLLRQGQRLQLEATLAEAAAPT
jgi:formylglycine-generating enzyme required for sulfatase activity